MGIKKYYNYLITNYPDIISKPPSTIFDIVAIDINSILHEISNRVKSTMDFKKLLFSRLDSIIKRHKPKLLGIFVDGQAVLAKIKTQMKRRDKYLYMDEMDIATSSLNLTPGTIFMDNFLHPALLEYLNLFEKTTGNKYFYSSSSIVNEGELKLFEWLVSMDISNKTVCIIGKDADIIVLSLLNTPLLNVSIYYDKQYISLFKLVKNLSHLTKLKFNYKHHPIRKDFVLLSLLLGNDYLPHIASFNLLFDKYKKLLTNNVGFLFNRNGSLQLNNLYYLLQDIPINDNIIYPKKNMYHYLQSIYWNLNLYTGKPLPNYLPETNINIKTILHHFPKNFYYNLDKKLSTKWLEPDVFLLLLMPIVGKPLIPNRLQMYMDNGSPIKDLFPEPCQICIEFKKKINKLKNDIENYQEDEYKKLTRNLNENYKQHLLDKHTINELPINRIRECLELENI